MARYMTEEEVMQKLGIDDWRHMSKDKVMQFASTLHKMDPEVAKKALEQFPNFVAYAGDMVKYYKESVDKVLQINTKQSEMYYEVCNSIIMILQKELERDELTVAQREMIIDHMIDLAGKIKAENEENRKFWLKVLGGIGALLTFFGAVLAAALGVFNKHDDDDDDDDDIAA